jgi:hypothetical protein
MHPYISQSIAAERTRDLQARAAQGRQAREARGSATTAARRAFHSTRPWARRSGNPATPIAWVPSQHDRVDVQVVEMPTSKRESPRRAA